MAKPDTKWVAGWNKIVNGWLKAAASLEDKINSKVSEKWCEKRDVASVLRKTKELTGKIEALRYKSQKNRG